MKRDDFLPAAPGALLSATGGLLAFDPHPLPPKGLQMDGDIWRAEVAAATELARLDTVLPAVELDPFLATYALVEREAFCTSRMEGTYTTPQDLALFDLSKPRDDGAEADPQTREVANYRTACRAACAQLAANQAITSSLIRGAHKILLAGTRGASKHPGEYRTTQNFIGRGIDGTAARFVPPPPEHVAAGLDNLQAFIAASISDGTEIPLMTSLALAHYQFETIHPFEDGNGRIGRLLIPLMLIAGGKLHHPVLHVSYTLEKHRTEYIDLMLRVSQRGEWKAWIIFFIKMLSGAAKDCASLVQRLQNLRREYRGMLLAPKRSVALQRLIDSLFASPGTTVRQAMVATKVGFAQTSEHLATLQKLGIVTEATGRARNRKYVASGILDLIFEGA